MVAETSRAAYHQLRNEGTQKQRILAALELGPASDAVLEKRTGIRRTSVTARRNALLDAGKVRPAYEDIDAETGVTVQLWELVR